MYFNSIKEKDRAEVKFDVILSEKNWELYMSINNVKLLTDDWKKLRRKYSKNIYLKYYGGISKSEKKLGWDLWCF